MKRNLINFVMTGIVVFGLASCKDNNQNTTSKHHYTENYLYDSQKHWKECTDNGCNQQVEVAIHEFLDWSIVEDSTCNKEGKEISKCSVCDYVLERSIPMKDHAINDEWSTDEQYHWHTCQNDPNEKVDYNAHSFDWVYSIEPTCTTGGKGHQECTVCEYKLPEVDIPANGHSWVVDEENTVYATCDEPGVVTHKCTVCGASETKNVPAGHGWLEATYEWNEDYSKVVATRVCGNNPNHIETETVQTTISHLSPTCTEEGNYTYTTKPFINTAFKQQTKVVKLEKCSETLEHHCEAVKYQAGDIYDECTICHKRYNERTCSAPWTDINLSSDFATCEATDNGAGQFSIYDAENQILDLHSTDANCKPAYLNFDSVGPVQKSLNKKYLVFTYTVLEGAGHSTENSWWDTYFFVTGYGTPTKIRFGKIDQNAVSNYDMSLATFIVNDEIVGWNGVTVGNTGTMILDVSSLKGGVTGLTIYSDGGAKLRVDYLGFRSSFCEHDLSCYKTQAGVSCAGYIKTSQDVCEECGNVTNIKTAELPAGFKALDLGNPKNVRYSTSIYDYKNHVVSCPNTYNPGPFFDAPDADRLLVEFSLDWDTSVTDANAAKARIYFFNNELDTNNDNMQNHCYSIDCNCSGLSSYIQAVNNPTPVNQLAKYLDYQTGEEISSFTKGQRLVVDINLSNPSVGDFAIMLLTGTVGTTITFYNVIYA